MHASTLLVVVALSFVAHEAVAQGASADEPRARELIAAAVVDHDSVAIALEGDGAGVVASWPSGLTCAASRCNGAFARGTTLTLSATPTSGSHFVGWTGVCAGLQRCVVRLHELGSVRARFALGSKVMR